MKTKPNSNTDLYIKRKGKYHWLLYDWTESPRGIIIDNVVYPCVYEFDKAEIIKIMELLKHGASLMNEVKEI